MTIVDLIEKKRDGYSLSKEEIDFIISGYTNGSIADYQMSSLLMAIYLKDMTDQEATDLTISMLNSGDQIDLSSIEGIKVDKHSTGGVGDKTSLVLAPIVASLRINVAKMSGRGLGHTGGTLDKLESMKGFDINLSNEQFVKQMNNINLALIGQTGNLTPADKKIYALRDVTGTVSSIPLIASSIMSKKLASGSDVICLDIKVGSGAFMKDIESATKLAKLMVSIGKNCDKKMTAMLTNMHEPLGYAVGNALEVIEAINTLKGHGPKDLTDLCVEISAYLVLDANKAQTLEEAKRLVLANIENGKALKKFEELLQAQGTSKDYISNYDLFDQTSEIIEVKAKTKGYVFSINALKIGHAAMLLGAGRLKLDDQIDYAVGIVLNKKVGDKVNEDEVLFTVYSNGKNTDQCIQEAFSAYEITQKQVSNKLIIDIIR